MDADQSTNIGIDNEVVGVIMNKLIDDLCDQIKSNNNVLMDNMKNGKENIEKNDEDAFSAEVDTPLIDVVSTDVVSKFPVITDTLRKNLTVKGPDDLQNQDKIESANIHEGRRLTKCFFTKQVGNDRNNLFLLFAIWEKK